MLSGRACAVCRGSSGRCGSAGVVAATACWRGCGRWRRRVRSQRGRSDPARWLGADVVWTLRAGTPVPRPPRTRGRGVSTATSMCRAQGRRDRFFAERAGWRGRGQADLALTPGATVHARRGRSGADDLLPGAGAGGAASTAERRRVPRLRLCRRAGGGGGASDVRIGRDGSPLGSSWPRGRDLGREHCRGDGGGGGGLTGGAGNRRDRLPAAARTAAAGIRPVRAAVGNSALAAVGVFFGGGGGGGYYDGAGSPDVGAGGGGSGFGPEGTTFAERRPRGERHDHDQLPRQPERPGGCAGERQHRPRTRSALADKAAAIQAAVNAEATASACAGVADYLRLVKAQTGKKRGPADPRPADQRGHEPGSRASGAENLRDAEAPADRAFALGWSRPGEREAPDDLVGLLSLSFEPEAGLLEDAVRRVAFRQRVGDHRRDTLVRRTPPRPSPASPPWRDRAPAALRRSRIRPRRRRCSADLETAPADQLRRISCHEEARAPGRSAWVRGKGIAGGRQRLGKRRPAGDDVVAERFCERVITRQRGVHQMKLGTDETDHGGQLLHDRRDERASPPRPSTLS